MKFTLPQRERTVHTHTHTHVHGPGHRGGNRGQLGAGSREGRTLIPPGGLQRWQEDPNHPFGYLQAQLLAAISCDLLTRCLLEKSRKQGETRLVTLTLALVKYGPGGKRRKRSLAKSAGIIPTCTPVSLASPHPGSRQHLRQSVHTSPLLWGPRPKKPPVIPGSAQKGQTNLPSTLSLVSLP